MNISKIGILAGALLLAALFPGMRNTVVALGHWASGQFHQSLPLEVKVVQARQELEGVQDAIINLDVDATLVCPHVSEFPIRLLPCHNVL